MRLASSSLGSGDPPLVLLHGYTGSQADWDPVAGALSERRRLITYDHRGHGQSDRAPAAEYTFDHLVADLEELVVELELPRFHLLGHSMGGVVAQRFAVAQPGRLASLVLMDTACRPANPMPMEIIARMAETGRRDGMEALAVQVTAQLGRPQDAERARRKLGAMDAEALEPFARELDSYPALCAGLAELDVPVTVIVGEQDGGLRAAADLMAATIPGSVLEVIPGAGHSPQEDQPDLWLAALERHLSRPPPAPR